MTPFRSALVTGATGFLGSALVQRLSAEQVKVMCLVRSSTRASGLACLPGVRLVEVTSFEKEELALKLSQVSAEVVFHLASYGVQQDDRDPAKLVDGNIGLLTPLLEIASKWKVKRFIHTGSCSEYGAPASEGVLIEETQPLQPLSPYGKAKAAAFFFGNTLAHKLQVPFLTLRLFGVFGPHEAPQRLIPYLLGRLWNRQPVDLTPGEQVRDLLFEEDVAEAFVEAVNTERLNFYEAYNVCSSIPVTIRSVGEMVAGKLNRSPELLHWGERQYRRDEPMWLVGNNGKFVRATSWRPRISLAEGLDRMIFNAGLPVGTG